MTGSLQATVYTGVDHLISNPLVLVLITNH